MEATGYRLSAKHKGAFAVRIARRRGCFWAYGAVYGRGGATAGKPDGSRLLRNAKVAARIRELQEKIADEAVMSQAAMARCLARTDAYTPIGEVNKDSYFAKKYVLRKSPKGETEWIEMFDKLKASDMLCRMCELVC